MELDLTLMALSDANIRTARVNEAAAISNVLFASFAEIRPLYTQGAFEATTPNASVIRNRFEEDGAIWVAELAEEIVGTVSCIPVGERLYIRSMAVLPAHRGGGIANGLLRVIQEFAVDHRFDTMFLFTSNVLVSAIRLYEKNGFRKIRDCTPEEFFGTAGIEMEKIVENGKESKNVVGS